MDTQTMPDNYVEIWHIDLQHNKKLAILLNLAALLIVALMLGVAIALVPIEIVFNIEFMFQSFGFAIFSILYIFAHELVHGVFIRIFTGKKAKYGFTGMFAYASSTELLGKQEYIVTSLAPLAVFGIIFTAMNLLLPPLWFWPVYLLQICNISGSVGDIFITAVVLRLPKDIRLKDEGTAMSAYSQAYQKKDELC